MLVGAQPQTRLGDSEVGVPAVPLGAPILEPAVALLGRDEVLHLHLLELTRAEDEVARCDLVSERLADLCDSERRLLAGRRLHVLEVDEDPLCGLGTEIRRVRVVLDGTDKRLEHEVELPGLGESVTLAAVRAGTAVGKIVFAESLLAVAAVDQGIGEGGEMTTGLPYPRCHQDRGIDADHVVAQLHHGAPPRVLDVALQQDTERPVVPRATEAPVDLAGREDEPAPLGEVDDTVHRVGIYRVAGHGGSG